MTIICNICEENCWHETDDFDVMKNDVELKFHDFEFQICTNCACGLGNLIQSKDKKLKELVVKEDEK